MINVRIGQAVIITTGVNQGKIAIVQTIPDKGPWYVLKVGGKQEAYHERDFVVHK